MQTSPSRAGRHSSCSLSKTGHSSATAARTIAATSAASRARSSAASMRPVVGVGLDAEQHDPAIVFRGHGARRVERPVLGLRARVGLDQLAKTWLIHPSTCGAVRKLHVRNRGAGSREAIARPRGTSRCRRAGSGRSTASDRRRRTGARDRRSSRSTGDRRRSGRRTRAARPARPGSDRCPGTRRSGCAGSAPTAGRARRHRVRDRAAACGRARAGRGSRAHRSRGAFATDRSM